MILCVDGIYFDVDEWMKLGWICGVSILYIELWCWVDFFVIVFMFVNFFVKVINGICDDFFICVICVWDVKVKIERLVFGQGSILVVLVMNMMMWVYFFIVK